MAMVALESVKAEPVGQTDDAALRALMSNHLEHDAPRLHRLIARHRHYTGSARAKEILDRWDYYLPKFVKIMPVDYSKSLKILAASRSRESDENTTFKLAGAN
jgi:glutamate synthase (NADPH/NADH) large chain